MLDLLLPVTDGTRVYDVMHGDPRLAQIPIVSSQSNPESAPPDVIARAKPFRLERLLRTIAELP